MQSLLPRYFRDDERISFNVHRLNFNGNTKEEKAIRIWRENCYTSTLKIKQSSILYKVFGKKTFTNRELAIAESFAQWLGTHVGECFVRSKLGNTNDYGKPSIPRFDYLVLTDLNNEDYIFLEKLSTYFLEKNTPTLKTYLKKIK